MVGFPKNLRALYVEQLEGTNADLSVLDTVMQADKEVLTWRHQASLLQAQLRLPCCHADDTLSSGFTRRPLQAAFLVEDYTPPLI